MLSNLGRRPIPVAQDPDDVMTGRCPTCKSVVECLRNQATRPDDKRDLTRGGNAEAGGFGAWYDLWSVECPACLAKTAKVTDPEGRTTQLEVGARVYLTKKGGGQ